MLQDALWTNRIQLKTELVQKSPATKFGRVSLLLFRHQYIIVAMFLFPYSQPLQLYNVCLHHNVRWRILRPMTELKPISQFSSVYWSYRCLPYGFWPTPSGITSPLNFPYDIAIWKLWPLDWPPPPCKSDFWRRLRWFWHLCPVQPCLLFAWLASRIGHVTLIDGVPLCWKSTTTTNTATTVLFHFNAQVC